MSGFIFTQSTYSTCQLNQAFIPVTRNSHCATHNPQLVTRNPKTPYSFQRSTSTRPRKNAKLAWDVNVNGLYNILKVARHCKCGVFTPSSIAAFGPNTPRDKTPQDTTQRPTTLYGITNAAEIKKIIPEFSLDYKLDPLLQAIADSWPNSLNDGAAREEWGWQPQYDLESMTRDMIENIKNKWELLNKDLLLDKNPDSVSGCH
jgi:nucleoside-diphosphate-sugar epimerase